MQFRVKDLAERAIAYGIPGVIVDGTDACQVYDACHEACERARREDYLVSKKKWLTLAENEKLIAGVERQLEADREIAVNSPMPLPESAAGGVYCEAGCHEIKPKYAMPVAVTIGARGGKAAGSEGAVHLK